LNPPRHGQPADFLVRRKGTTAIGVPASHGWTRHRLAGLTDATANASSHAHQLRHTTGPARQRRHVLQALMALMGHVSAEMTCATRPRVRRRSSAYEAAMQRCTPPRRLRRRHRTWHRTDRVDGSDPRCSRPRRSRLLLRDLDRDVAYANICEQCDNYVAAPSFNPSRSPTRRHPRLRDRPKHAVELRSRPPRTRRRQHRRGTSDGSEIKPDQRTSCLTRPEGRLMTCSPTAHGTGTHRGQGPPRHHRTGWQLERRSAHMWAQEAERFRQSSLHM